MFKFKADTSRELEFSPDGKTCVVPVIEVKTGFRISIAMSHDDLEAFLAAEILELTDSCGGIKH